MLLGERHSLVAIANLTSDQRGTALAAGVYLVRLSYPGGEQTRRLLLLK